MAIDITVPRLGWNMDEGVFVAWLKADGEFVRAGEPLFSLETDKAVQEVESLDTGTLHILPTGPQPGGTVAVGTVIGPARPARGKRDDEVRSVTTTLAVHRGTLPRPLDEAKAPTERVAISRSSSRTVRASPRARRKARELSIDWTVLEGSGGGGRVRERDVIAASATRGTQPHAALADGDFEAIPISPVRRAHRRPSDNERSRHGARHLDVHDRRNQPRQSAATVQGRGTEAG